MLRFPRLNFNPALAVLLIVGSLPNLALAQVAAAGLANGESTQFSGQQSPSQSLHEARPKSEGSFKSFGPAPGTNLGPQTDNPLIGSWKARQPMQTGGGELVMYAQYLPDGKFRMTSIAVGGSFDGSRMQVWGNYSLKQTNQNHYEMTVSAKGIAPTTICLTGGTCRPNQIPPIDIETEEILDGDNFRCKAKTGGEKANEVTAHRSAIPEEMETTVAEILTLPAPARSVVPRPPFDNGPEGCDNLQQYRICVVNDGKLTTDTRGCKVCVSPEPPKTDSPK